MDTTTDKPVQLSIVIPCFNEEHRLPVGLDKIADFLDHLPLDTEVVVVSDGSTDQTVARAEERRSRFAHFKLILGDRNQGKGHALRRGVRAARGRFVLCTDCDLSTPIDEALPLLERLEKGADVAIASRRLGTSNIELPQPFHRRLMGTVFVRIQRALVGVPFKDTQCGFKMFQRDAAKELFEVSVLTGYCLDVEILALAVAAGYRVDEVPVRWRDDRGSRMTLAWDVFQMLFELARIRWNLIRRIYRLQGPRPQHTPPSEK